jgi:insertion element IS1 protein InsB
MTDGWPLYESRLKESCVISKRYTQPLSHNLNLRQHLAGTEVTVVLKIGGAA